MKFTIPFILASASPRRRKLLTQIGIDFEVRPSEVDETPPPNLSPEDIAATLALKKAQDVAASRPRALTLGADTIVVYEGTILGKPDGTDEAVRMLGMLNGRTHTVYTGIALVHPASGRSLTSVEATRVTFGKMDANEIASYVATGSPMDKAGAYGIQDDRGALFISRIDGDYYNVVGLPLHRLYRMLKEHFTDLLISEVLL
ncbi:MAG: Maf family protein [Rhodothermales bacterium]